MNNYDNTNKGVVWLKTSKNGLKYMSGLVDVKGVEFDIAMFKNDKKGNDKAPDYRLVITSKEEKQQELSQSEIIKSAMNEESDPFSSFYRDNKEDVDNLDDLLPF
ncbi:MAG: hypothetical protein PHU05_04000 [Bacilli bacterium]|nr:hypothetical protein [Bacilli bacterium]